MDFIQAYLTGLRSTFQQQKLWLLLYALNFLFAMFLAFPLSSYLDDKLGNTLAIDKLKEGFDYTVFYDFMKDYGDIAGFILDQSLVGLGLYLILSIFLIGGILKIFIEKPKHSSLSAFWDGASSYFWRMLRLTVYFIIIHFLLLVLFFTIFSFLTAGGLERFRNESEIIQRGLVLTPIYLFFATVVFMIQDYAKINLVSTNSRYLFQPIWQSVRWISKNFTQSFLLYILNFLTFGILFAIYWQVEPNNALFLAFIISQLFILSRIGTKLLNLASATQLYQSRQE